MNNEISIPEIFIEFKLNGINRNFPVNNIYGIGKNFDKHISEGKWQEKEPVIFMKPRTSLYNTRGEILLPAFSSEVHYEVELVLFIGKEGKDIPASEAGSYIFGIGIGLDLTARDVQQKSRELGHPWAVCKGFDQSALVSHFIKMENITNVNNLGLSLWKNGEIGQNGNTEHMILKPLAVVSYISKYFSLFPGDMIFTGTPEGVGPIKSKDEIKIQLEENGKGIISKKFNFL